DETTNISHTLLSRFGLYKKELESTLNLFDISTKGTIAGEGAAFFLLANEPSASDYAQLEGMATFYNNGSLQETESRIANFLLDQSIAFDEIDLVITGRNGDVVSDKNYSFIEQSAFKNIPAINYKHLCGEYPTSTAFALWLGVNIIKSGALPASMRSDTGEAKQIKRILIYNNFQHTHHSLVLISAC
ncbi:MAG: beta-ketoacyl synthase, partial [Ferruginibacter sp.]